MSNSREKLGIRAVSSSQRLGRKLTGVESVQNNMTVTNKITAK